MAADPLDRNYQATLNTETAGLVASPNDSASAGQAGWGKVKNNLSNIKPEADASQSCVQNLKVFVAIATPAALLTAEALHQFQCGFHELGEKCDNFPPWFEGMLTWCNILCDAGLWVVFTSFAVNTYLCWRAGRFNRHILNTFLGGGEESCEAPLELNAKNVPSSVLSLAILVGLVADVWLGKSSPFLLHAISYWLNQLCHCVILACFACFLFEFLVALGHLNCEVLENFFRSCLACDRELEGYSAVAFDENELVDEDLEARIHNNDVEQKPVDDWIMVIVNWFVFLNVIYLGWLNWVYFKNFLLQHVLDTVGCVCTAGLAMVILTDFYSLGEHILALRIGNFMSSVGSKGREITNSGQ